MSNCVGETAGLLTSLFFAINSVFITIAGRQVGAVVSNRTRVVFALFYLVILNVIFYRQPLAFQADAKRWAWFSLSGVTGLALGDAFLFQSYLSIGPRLGNLLLSLSPIMAAPEARLFLHEALGPTQIAGILVTLAGIAWVVLERSNGRREPVPQHIILCILFGILAAVCQATGLVFSRQSLYDHFPPIQANAIRMLAAALMLWLIASLQRQVGQTVGGLRAHPNALKFLIAAGLVGPVPGAGRFAFTAGGPERRGRRGQHAHGMDKKPYIFLLTFPHHWPSSNLHWQNSVELTARFVLAANLFLADILFVRLFR